MAIGMMATRELALAFFWPTPAHSTCSGIITKPPPTPRRPPRKPPRNPIAAKIARRSMRLIKGSPRTLGEASEFVGFLFRGLGLWLGRGRHHRVVPELDVSQRLRARPLRLLFLLDLATLLVSSFSHGPQFL